MQQRVLPAYRAPFFDALGTACAGGLSLFAGQPLPEESIASIDSLHVAHYVSAHNRHLFSPASPFYQCWQDGLLRWLQDWQPDALIVEANPRYLSTPQAVRWMHARRRPVLGWGLGAPPIRGPLAGWRARSRRAFLQSLDGLIAYSQRGAQEYQTLGFSPQRIFVAPNAVAPRPTRPPPERPEGYLGQPGVLFVGRLQARKRIDNLLHACAALPESMQPRLWIVGDGPARAEFQELAENIYPQAEFTGARHGSELEQYFAAADLFALPGTGGLAVQQAMAHGLPVIVAQGDGTQDDLVRMENGWLIPPDDLQALSGTLQIALSDPARLRQMGTASYRIVSEEANLENMVAAFMRALSSVNIV
ncbi:MAG: glycosyltransferase [Chloroflexota bacterium]